MDLPISEVVNLLFGSEAGAESAEQGSLVENIIRSAVRQEFERLLRLPSDHNPFGFEAQYSAIVAEILPRLRLVVRQEIEKALRLQFDLIQSLPRSGQLNNQIGEEVATESRKSQLELRFLNRKIDSKIFAGNMITLQVAIFDPTNGSIVGIGSVSSASIEIVVLDGEFLSGPWQEETNWTVENFNDSIVFERKGRRPLIVGDKELNLVNGIAFTKNLTFTDNSHWVKSKLFRFGARIIDEAILVEFSRIKEAVSQPFRVKDQRGEANKKHHPPRAEDELWRLKWIQKDGKSHVRLSAEGIKTVGDFLKTYYDPKKGPSYLRELLGKKISDKIWKEIVHHASECDDFASRFGKFFVGNDQAMGGEAFNENPRLAELNHQFHEASTSNQHNYYELGNAAAAMDLGSSWFSNPNEPNWP